MEVVLLYTVTLLVLLRCPAGHLSKTNNVTVYNRTTSKSKKWIEDFNGTILLNLSEIDSHYDFVISCIGNDEDLIEITTAENGCFKLLS